MNDLSSFVEHPRKYKYKGIDRDEQIDYVLRQSLFTTIPWITITVLLILLPAIIFPYIKSENIFSEHLIITLNFFWYLVTMGFFFVKFSNWYFNVYIISNKKIIDMDYTGIIFSNISETTLDHIEDVTSETKGLLGTVLNIGHVYIQTAAEQKELEFENVDKPAVIRDLIADIAARHRNGHKWKKQA